MEPAEPISFLRGNSRPKETHPQSNNLGEGLACGSDWYDACGYAIDSEILRQYASELEEQKEKSTSFFHAAFNELKHTWGWISLPKTFTVSKELEQVGASFCTFAVFAGQPTSSLEWSMPRRVEYSQVESSHFGAHILATKSQSDFKVAYISNETDKIEDSRNAFQNLKLPPPGDHHQIFTSLVCGSKCVRTHQHMLVIRGVKSSKSCVTNECACEHSSQQTLGGFKCEISSASLGNACGHWKRRDQKSNRKLKGSLRGFPLSLRKIQRFKKKLSWRWLGYWN